jgi:hypothetical protein
MYKTASRSKGFGVGLAPGKTLPNMIAGIMRREFIT